MSLEPLLTSAGWSLNGLITQGDRFREIPRISVSDKNLEATVRKHESSGVPLVIEGMHGHQAWPTDLFNIQWLCENLKQQIQVRNVRNRRDLDVSFTDFLEHIRSIHCYASADETSRWYAKDVECPREWKEWLDTTSLVPRSLCPHGPADIMQNLPEEDRVETLMCYLGVGDTFTPCHKDLCASFGHNLMCYAEDGGSAFWFMTDGSAALLMAKYFQSLGQELDMESHAMSIEEFAAAPCDIYITEQKVGDLVLVPPRSCHQVVNHCGFTVKMSWSRMTIRSTQIALRHELPIYRRVCRAETYRVKSTIHHTLRRNTGLLEDLGKGKDGGTSFHDILRGQLANDVQKLLELFRQVILEECYLNAETLDHVIRDFNHNVYDTEGYPAFSCDFCGSDIFVSFFCCKQCSPLTKSPTSIYDGLHICPGCYAEGRSCGCGGPMEPVQCWPLQILYGDYNRAVRALKVVGVNVFDEVEDHGILDNSVTGVFEAGIAILRWRTEVNKGGSLCHASAQPHAVHNAATLYCKKCRKGHCFVHLAEAGIHSSEAVTLYKKSPEQNIWHEFHLAKRTDKETILAAEASGDDVFNLMGQKLAIIALSFSHCLPMTNTSLIKPGWYDRLKFPGVATLGPSDAMDMSFPRDGSDWGSSSLTDLSPQDSVGNDTLIGTQTPPREPATAQSSTVRTFGSMKRKRTSVVFDGVAPPGRKRKMNARYSESHRGAALPPRSATYVKGNEKSQGPQSSAIALESPSIQATSGIDTLITMVAAQTRKIDKLVQDNAGLRNEVSKTVRDNAGLRDEIRNLSQAVQSSKRDMQRVENIMTKMTTDSKIKFESLLEKSENRMLGPIHELSEQLRMTRANPPAPVHMPSHTAYPSTAPFPPEPCDSDWGIHGDYARTGPNRPYYQENYEKHRQSDNKYNRGNSRPFRGRGRGSRGGHAGDRPPNQRSYISEGWGFVRLSGTPSTPVAAPLEHFSISADSYHSQGYAPPPQNPPTPSHSYPHTIPSPSTQTRPHPHTRNPPPTSPSSPKQTRHHPHAARPQAYEYDHVRHRDHPHPSPRSHDWRRPTPAPAPVSAPPAADDGGYCEARYTDSYAIHSPALSDEKLRWTSTPSDSVGGGQRRNSHSHSQDQSHSQSRGSSPSRSYAEHNRHADEVRSGERR